MWLRNFYRECQAWRIVRRVEKESAEELNKIGLKKDWIGRMYKVINRDFKYKLGSQEDAILLRDELEEINQVLLKLNIVDIMVFQLIPIESETENSYLITFTPCYIPGKSYVTVRNIILLTLGWMSILALVALVLFLIF